MGLISETEDDLMGGSSGIVRERNDIHDFQMFDEFFFCSLVIFMGTVYSAVDIANVAPDFEKGVDSFGPSFSFLIALGNSEGGFFDKSALGKEKNEAFEFRNGPVVITFSQEGFSKRKLSGRRISLPFNGTDS